jgi:hypothetical protein
MKYFLVLQYNLQGYVFDLYLVYDRAAQPHAALWCDVQFFAYKMTVASENSMLKHRNVDLNTVSL